jgi:hypothetical protein
VRKGGVVCGAKPRRAPGLEGFPGSDEELQRLADEMWGSTPAGGIMQKNFGAGQIYWGGSLGEVFARQHIAPEFTYRSSTAASLDFLHRTEGGAEVYFVVNRSNREEQAECAFRVSGKKPELWDPVTGESRPSAAFRGISTMTTVPLEFAPYGSWFVVFRKPLSGAAQVEAGGNFPHYSHETELAGPWTVSFDPRWGGPASARFDKLQSWTTRPEDGIKYYSGTATYRKTFDLPAALRGTGARVALDLGEVKYAAQVRLNGQNLGPLWTPPFRVDITSVVKPTDNVLEIDVANLWPNRIIGDARLPPERRYTHTNITYKADTPLWPSGLLGPVKLELIGWR